MPPERLAELANGDRIAIDLRHHVAAAAGQVAVGFALASASAAGDIIDVKIARHAAA